MIPNLKERKLLRLNNKKSVVQAMQLPVDKLHPFEGHPFQVKDDNQSIAASILPSVASNAFLQSNIPAPVVSLSSFTILALIIFISPYN